MAFCVKCGTKLEDGTVFCTNCGAKVESAAAPTPAAPQAATTNTTNGMGATTATSNIGMGAPATGKGGAPKLAFVIAGLVLALIIALGIFVSIRKHTMDLNDYLQVEFEGYESVGIAKGELFTSEFFEDFYKKASKSATSSGSYDDLSNKIKFKFEKAEGLSNGDKVKVTWKVDEKYFKKQYGIRFKADDNEIKVKGLEETEVFDPFKGVEVVFTGVDGEGKAEINVTSDDKIYKDLEYRADPFYDLKEGDTVTVEVRTKDSYDEASTIEACAEKYDKVPSVVSKEFKVEGLGKYITKCSDITDANIKDIKKVAEDKITQEFAKGYSSDKVKLAGTEYVGNYVLTEKNDGTNKVFLVFKNTVTISDEGQTDGCDVYNAVEFDNVVINEKGELSCDLSRSRMEYNSYRYESSIRSRYYTYSYSIQGFENLESLNENVVTGNLANYNSDSSIAAAGAAPAEDAE